MIQSTHLFDCCKPCWIHPRIGINKLEQQLKDRLMKYRTTCSCESPQRNIFGKCINCALPMPKDPAAVQLGRKGRRPKKKRETK